MNNEEKILSMLEQHGALLETLVNKVNKLETDVAEVKADVAEVKADVARVKVDVAETKEHVILIENEQGKKLGAALDGYTQLYEISCEIRANVGALQARQEKHAMQITFLEAEYETQKAKKFNAV